MLRPTRFEASRRRWTGLLLTTIWRDEFRRSNNFVASVSKWTRRVSNNTNTVAPKTVTEKNSKTRAQKRSAEIFSRVVSTAHSPRTFCTFRRELSSLRRTVSRRRSARNVLEELSGVSERPIIIPMTTTARPQQRYYHRRRDLVQGTGDVTIATGLGVPRSTAREW